MRSYNPSLTVHRHGAHWVDAYKTRKGNGESFAYEAEHIVQVNIQDVWSAFQQIEYFDVWFLGHGPSRTDEELPVHFGPGQPTPDHRATIVQCSLRDGIVFRQYDAFFLLKLTDYGPAATLMRLRCFDLYERRPGVLSRAIMSIAAKKDRDQSGDEESTRRRLVRLGNLAEDLKDYGQPVSGNIINGKTLHWVNWHNAEGVLHVLPDEQGRNRFERGSSCRSGKVGYVIPDHLNDSGNTERYYIENWYVESYCDGKILKVKKNHGDRVSPGDRMVLIECENQT